MLYYFFSFLKDPPVFFALSNFYLLPPMHCAIKNSSYRMLNDNINLEFFKKMCKKSYQLQIFVEDLHKKKLIRDYNKRSISNIINCKHLLTICI